MDAGTWMELGPWPCILLLLPALGCWRDIPGLWPTAGVIVYPWPVAVTPSTGGARSGPWSLALHPAAAPCALGCWRDIPGLWPTASMIVYPWPVAFIPSTSGARSGPWSLALHEVHARLCCFWLLLPGPPCAGPAASPSGLGAGWRDIPGPSGPGCDES